MDFNNWKGRNFTDVITDFADFLDEVKEIYYKNKDIEVEMNKKQQDLLHDLELEDLKYHDIAKLGKEIRALRQNRREYKNEYLLSEPIKNFVKDNGGDKLISDLRNLADEIRKTSYKIENQFYNKRSTIENITEIKKDSNKEDDSQAEDLIQLNRVLNKYCINLENSLNGIDDELNCPILQCKMQLENQFGLKRGKDFIQSLSRNIEKFYRPGLKNITCKATSSDMVIQDEYNKNTLFGIIKICYDDEVLYSLHIKIREGKGSDQKKGKKKGGKKRR